MKYNQREKEEKQTNMEDQPGPQIIQKHNGLFVDRQEMTDLLELTTRRISNAYSARARKFAPLVGM